MNLIWIVGIINNYKCKMYSQQSDINDYPMYSLNNLDNQHDITNTVPVYRYTSLYNNDTVVGIPQHNPYLYSPNYCQTQNEQNNLITNNQLVTNNNQLVKNDVNDVNDVDCDYSGCFWRVIGGATISIGILIMLLLWNYNINPNIKNNTMSNITY